MLIKGLLALMFLARPVYETVGNVGTVRLISDEISDKSYDFIGKPRIITYGVGDITCTRISEIYHPTTYCSQDVPPQMWEVMHNSWQEDNA